MCSEVGNEKQVWEMVQSIAKDARITCKYLPLNAALHGSTLWQFGYLWIWADSISGTQKFEIASDQVQWTILGEWLVDWSVEVIFIIKNPYCRLPWPKCSDWWLKTSNVFASGAKSGQPFNVCFSYEIRTTKVLVVLVLLPFESRISFELSIIFTGTGV